MAAVALAIAGWMSVCAAVTVLLGNSRMSDLLS
jgi:hypothetical protein